MKRIFFLLLSLFVFFRSFGQLDVDKTIEVDGVERQYSLHLPLSFHSFKKIPVIFAMHGDETDNKGVIKLYNLNDLADEQHFVIVYPSALDRHWNVPWMHAHDSTATADDSDNTDDVHFIKAIIDTLAIAYKEDTNHIFATGMGRGGLFALYVASKLPDKIKAVASVCTSVPRSFADAFSLPRPIPVLLINGTTDPFLNYNGGKGKMDQPGGKNIDMLSTEDFVDKLAKTDSCGDDADPAVADVPRNKNGGNECSAVETIYNCSVMIDFIAVINGGHCWPGRYQYLPKIFPGKVCRDFNAEDRIVPFFQSITVK
jgi:polyhydroxybutyrate depolymerase